MKYLFCSLFICIIRFSFSQNFTAQVEKHNSIPLFKQVDLSHSDFEDWEVNVLNIRQQPMPASDYGNKKRLLNDLRLQKQNLSNGSRGGNNTPTPIMDNNFMGNPASGTPNDNHIAISNAGKIVSVVNTGIRIYDELGTQLQAKTLIGFAGLQIGTSSSDPRVLYDPWEDRFIIHFFSGNTSSNNKLYIGFSQTNDPTGVWNIYQLSGNFLNDSTWSDYPIVALNDKDFFMTYNHLKDGEDWKTGFRYSAIWQIDKTNAYAGDTLQFSYWHDIKYQGKPIWNVCVVQPSYSNPLAETYFLSVRPSDLSNDTVFLHTVSNSYESGTAQFSTKILKTSVPYGLPPNGLQTDGQFLATNDARILSAFVENNRIQYVQNTIDPSHATASVYVGDIENPGSNSPSISGQIISKPNTDFAYPSIAYMGNNQFDHRALITCSYSSPDTFPGTVAFYRDAQGNLSDYRVIKNGLNTVDVLQDSTERWGDYTGIQRKFNEPNSAWLAGSYTLQSKIWRTWIAKITNEDSSTVSSVRDSKSINANTVVFPNPANQNFSVKFESTFGNFTKMELFNAAGQLVKVLFEDRLKAGTNLFNFSTAYLATGTYLLRISDNNKLVKTEQVIVQH